MPVVESRPTKLELIVGATHASPLQGHSVIGLVVQPALFWVSAANDRCTLDAENYWRGVPDLIN